MELGGLSKRKPVAAEVVELAESLVSRASNLASRVDISLEPVITPYCSGKRLEAGKEEDAAKYPPLFATFRGNLFAIEESLNRIEETLSRLEL